MCLTQQSKTIRLTKDETYWKVFSQYSDGELGTVHNRGQAAQTQGKANKKFDTRNGYQVFETFKKAQKYAVSLSHCSAAFVRFPVKRVLVKRSALKREGIIGYGFIGAGFKAVRVSSYTLCEP